MIAPLQLSNNVRVIYIQGADQSIFNLLSASALLIPASFNISTTHTAHLRQTHQILFSWFGWPDYKQSYYACFLRFNLRSFTVPSNASTSQLPPTILHFAGFTNKLATKPKEQNNLYTMQKEKRETKIQDFEVEYKLGQGAYGYVFLASRNGQEYAIKELSKQQLKKCDSEHQPLVEKQVLRLAKHPGIVKSHFAFQSNSKLYLALEVCQTRLDGLVRQHLLSEQAKRFLVAELVDVLDYLRRNGIVHRDLKPSNLMLSNGHLKLIDFGTASLDKCSLVSDVFKDRLAAFRGKGHNKQNQQTQVTKWQTEEAKSGVQRMHRRKSSFVGTSQYISPQLLELNECEFAADLWALGCVVYFLYYGESPFSGVCELQVYHKIKQAEVVFPENAQLSGEARDLMMKLLVKDPEQRLGSCSRQDLSFAALKRHPYFANLDFHHLFTTLPPYLHQTLLSHNQPSSFKGNSLQKTLIKHTEDRGDVVCQVRYKSGSILEQTEVGGDSHSHRSYKLQLDIQNKLAHQLGERRFSLGVQNSQRLIYTSQDAASICQFFNSVAQADRQ